MNKKLFAMAALFLLAACTDARMQFNQQSLADMKGQNISAVKEMLGEPQRSYVKEGKTYLIYTTTYQTYTPATATPYLSPGQQGQAGQAGALGSYAPASCITTFTAEKGIVSQVNTQGNCL